MRDNIFEQLEATLRGNVAAMNRYTELLASEGSRQTLRSDIAATAEIMKAVGSTVDRINKLMMASDQVFSVAEVLRLMELLADALAESALDAARRLPLPEEKQDDHRYYLVDETTRRFREAAEEWRRTIVERRRIGVGAFDNKELGHDSNG